MHMTFFFVGEMFFVGEAAFLLLEICFFVGEAAFLLLEICECLINNLIISYKTTSPEKMAYTAQRFPT